MSTRVLVVEDYRDFREMVDFYLTTEGFEVINAADGAEAVKLSSSANPHIIVMDLFLPVLDGCEATKKIRQNHSTREIPIIAVSSNCLSRLGKRILKEGAIECVQKPLEIERLPGLIKTYALSEAADT